MKALRILLALLLATTTIAVITRAVVPRIRCNLAKGEINRSVRRIDRIASEYERIVRARTNIAKCQQCLALYPEDYQLHVLRAANLRILGSYDEAVRTFEHALTLTERPEIYAQIGELEIERGNIDAAKRALTKAAAFNLTYIETVDDPLRTEIYTATLARYEKLRARTR